MKKEDSLKNKTEVKYLNSEENAEYNIIDEKTKHGFLEALKIIFLPNKKVSDSWEETNITNREKNILKQGEKNLKDIEFNMKYRDKEIDVNSRKIRKNINNKFKTYSRDIHKEMELQEQRKKEPMNGQDITD